jgi:hypothetical protein
LLAAAAAAGALLGAFVAPASADQADYARGYELGTKAYQYGIPVVDTRRIYRTATSVSKSDGHGNGPVNRFSHGRRLATPEDRTVVAPNNDTLYSLAWLNLAHQPQVLHIPKLEDRFFVFEFVSPWTENFRNIGTPTGNSRGGDFAFVGPGFRGKLPRGVTKVKSPYDRVWVIGRTLIDGESDTEAVNRIQNRYRITPLRKFGTGYKPKKIKPVDTTLDEATIPGLGPGDDPLDFYAALGRELERFAAPAADQPLLDEIAAIGVGPGLDPATDPSLDADTLAGMRAAVGDGPDNVQALVRGRFVDGFESHDGYLIGDLGRYGTDYELRAMADKLGVGALIPKIAIYPFAQTSRDLVPLNGARRYVMHLPADRLPIPARGLWSLTMYDAEMFLVANPADRYVLNDRSDLRYNPDGSLDLYVQHDEPADPQQARNWLPAPAGAFRLLWRLYDSGPAVAGILDGTGWLPPAILPCGAGGTATDGTPCAS